MPRGMAKIIILIIIIIINADLENKLTVASGEGWEEGVVKELGINM